MLRKLVLAGMVAGASASVPILYQNNPEALESLLRHDGGGVEQPAAPAPTIAMARPQDPALRAETSGGRRVQVAADTRGHFNADFKLNGRTVPALVDTGASLVAINATTARRIGLNLSQRDFTAWAETANGRARAAVATLDRISVGRIEFRDVQVMVLDDRALSSTLIGMSFLSRLKRWQVENGTMVLEQ